MSSVVTSGCRAYSAAAAPAPAPDSSTCTRRKPPGCARSEARPTPGAAWYRGCRRKSSTVCEALCPLVPGIIALARSRTVSSAPSQPAEATSRRTWRGRSPPLDIKDATSRGGAPHARLRLQVSKRCQLARDLNSLSPMEHVAPSQVGKLQVRNLISGRVWHSYFSHPTQHSKYVWLKFWLKVWHLKHYSNIWLKVWNSFGKHPSRRTKKRGFDQTHTVSVTVAGVVWQTIA